VSRKPRVETPAFELISIPAMLVDEPNVAGGGNPNATVPPEIPIPQPPARQTAPPVQAIKPEPKPVEPERQTPEVKPPEPKPVEPKPSPKPKPVDPASFDLNKAVKKEPEPKPEKPESAFDFGKAERKTIRPTNKEQDNKGSREKQVADARAGALSDALKRVQSGLSTVGGSYEIPGPGGPAYASYYLALRKFYENAWIPPTVARGDEPVVEVEVVIARDGTILSQRILKISGRRALDASVQSTLDRVMKARAPAFPAGSNDQKRTFRINFNLTDKLG
jgi:TonB family protein